MLFLPQRGMRRQRRRGKKYPLGGLSFAFLRRKHRIALYLSLRLSFAYTPIPLYPYAPSVRRRRRRGDRRREPQAKGYGVIAEGEGNPTFGSGKRS